MSVARRGGRRDQRGAVVAMEPRIRAEVGAIALVAVALLGMAQHYGPGDPAAGDSAGGYAGAAVAKLAAAALGDVGAPIFLFALLLVGIVVTANRTLAQLARPAWRRRGSLRPGEVLGSGTGLRFAHEAADEEDVAELPEPLRINLPVDRPRVHVLAPDEDAGSPAAAAPLAPPVVPAGAAPLLGLPSAAVAAEGVLHADPPDQPWTLPPLDLLEEGSAARSGKDEVLRNKRLIEETLAHFSIAAAVVEVSVGPVVTRYELKPAPGVKLSRIEALADDLALALAARSLRIEAPIPGKSVVGIEIPNMAIGIVSLRDVAESIEFRSGTSKVTVALGKDVAGSPLVTELARLPHLLVAGQTGSGKSVCISAILCSLLIQATPDEVRLVIGDLKRVDFPMFNGLPHLVVPVLNDAHQILNALYWTTSEMDRRYRLFARSSARNIAAYNEKQTGSDRVPYVIFVIDELADLMLQAPIQVEKQITRIAQLARATGIHLVLGTQRPSVDVITGLIKANIPARIAFATASAVDSRTILDMTGAEKLLGRGDMLWLAPDSAKPVRAQGAFVSDREIDAVTRHWKQQRAPRYDLSVVQDKDRARARDDLGDEIDDDRYEEAVEIVRRAGQASVSMLQRKMTVGFARAGRLIDIMEQQGVVGPPKGPGKMRDVYGGPRAEAQPAERQVGRD